MSVLAQLSQDLQVAQKTGNKVKTSTLRFMLAKIHDAQIKKGKDTSLKDSEIQAEILAEVKRHQESIESFEAAGRTDLAEKEKSELAILEKYLPKQLTKSEIVKLVDEMISEIGAKSTADFGKVMGAVMPKIAGRASGSEVSQIVKNKLAPE